MGGITVKVCHNKCGNSKGGVFFIYFFVALLHLTAPYYAFARTPANDWIVHKDTTPATLSVAADSCQMTLSNGMIARRFALPSTSCKDPFPNFATLDFMDLRGVVSGGPRSLLAALDIEASVQLNNVTYPVGGFNNSAQCASWQPSNQGVDPFSTCTYLNRSQPSNSRPTFNPKSFRYVSYTTGPITYPFEYTPARHALRSSVWPPKGLHLAVTFGPPSTATNGVQDVTVVVHYNMLEGVPAMTKWVEVVAPYKGTITSSMASPKSTGAEDIVVGNVVVETLRVNDDFAGTTYANAVPLHFAAPQPLLMATVDVAHGAACTWGSRTEETYNSNPYVSCAYLGVPSSGVTCHAHAHPAEVCPGTGTTCPQCGKDICPCPDVTLPAGAFASIKDASSSYFYPRAANSTTDYVFRSFETRLLVVESGADQVLNGRSSQQG